MATSRSGLPYEGLWQRCVHHPCKPLAEAASLCAACPAVPRREDFCLASGGESCLPCVVTRAAVRPSQRIRDGLCERSECQPLRLSFGAIGLEHAPLCL